MPKIALGITGLLEILGRDYGIEEPYWGPSLKALYFHQLIEYCAVRLRPEA